MEITASVLQAWRVNARVNEVLLSHLTPEMLDAATPGGGYTVVQHLAHLTASLKYWASHLDAGDELLALPDLLDREAYQQDDEAFVAERDLERIRAVRADTVAKALEAAQAQPAGSKGQLPHASVEAFLIHMLVHDAHHRGQILLALKTAGHPLPDEDATWAPWRGG